jgi:hypothetical protein
MRRTVIAIAVLLALAVLVLAGMLVGFELANDRWVSDMNRLGTALQRLDRDIKAGRVSPGDGEYFRKLSGLPLERFDDKSVTYYVGPLARYSATIEFDQSCVKGFSVRAPGAPAR